jgi:hypothetical protein
VLSPVATQTIEFSPASSIEKAHSSRWYCSPGFFASSNGPLRSNATRVAGNVPSSSR